ncbi:MAG: hypothetical protein A3Q59_05135 [Methanomethylophilus alvi]|nr:MAG: hypothetical protein A3Q59_05135 [Methanomethylophilus alvi]
MNIGQSIYDLFGGNGEIGILLCIFLIFLLDALVIPTLPELFFVIGFMAGTEYTDVPVLFGCELIAAAAAAELIGIFSLYYVVEHIRIPKKVEKAVGAYTDFLVLGDERLLLLNRVAPMIPFAGAFISIMKWNPAKCAFYIVLGCVLKYGIIMLLSDFFYGFFDSGDAQTFTLIMIFAVIGASMALSLYLKKRNGIGNGKDPDT